MIKILHSADWHLDAPLRSLPADQAQRLRREMGKIPQRVADLCRGQGCQMMLLSGDLFDGPYTQESLDAVRRALAEAAVPVFIAPGNHDYVWERSPYACEEWPENVHIFKNNTVESVAVPELDCRVYGGAFTSAESSGLLEGFRAEGQERYAIGVVHGDPTSAASPYGPITAYQIQESGLDYLALGHIHQAGSFQAGSTLAAWPGCAMGHGFDETGLKGALVVSVGEEIVADFYPIPGVRFFDLELRPGVHADDLFPAKGSSDFYRLTLVGETEPPELDILRAKLERFPNLILRDRTRPPVDLWANAGEDSLQGAFFGILRDAREGQDEETVRTLDLAAKISRQILLGREVELP